MYIRPERDNYDKKDNTLLFSFWNIRIAKYFMEIKQEVYNDAMKHDRWTTPKIGKVWISEQHAAPFA